MTLSRL